MPFSCAFPSARYSVMSRPSASTNGIPLQSGLAESTSALRRQTREEDTPQRPFRLQLRSYRAEFAQQRLVHRACTSTQVTQLIRTSLERTAPGNRKASRRCLANLATTFGLPKDLLSILHVRHAIALVRECRAVGPRKRLPPAFLAAGGGSRNRKGAELHCG